MSLLKISTFVVALVALAVASPAIHPPVEIEPRLRADPPIKEPRLHADPPIMEPRNFDEAVGSPSIHPPVEIEPRLRAYPPIKEPRLHADPPIMEPRNFDDEDRIVNGKDAILGQLPYQVSIRDNTGSHFCGGTMLDSMTVLCAAHCFDPANGDVMDGFTATAGALRLPSATATLAELGQTIQIASIIRTEGDLAYSGNNNDIVMLKLKEAITNSPNAVAAVLPTGDPTPGTTVIVSGWGTISYGGTSPNRLLYAGVPIVDQASCTIAYGSVITDSMICAGFKDGGTDSCQGDSGGPLVWNSDDTLGKNVIVGVVSFGYGCAKANYPGVYARVTKFLAWINQHLESGSAPAPPPPSPPAPAPITLDCYVRDWYQDGECDDQNNTKECNYDGNDCCTDTVRQYCSICECIKN